MTEQYNLSTENFSTIKKRDGREVAFDASKIFDAIKAAFVESKESSDNNVFVKLTNYVVKKLAEKGIKVPDVETIQDVVQFVLRHFGYIKTAQHYIAYRLKRTKEREKNSELFKKGDEICNSDVQDSDAKRENANVNGATAMGQMLHFGSTFAKEYYTTNLIDSRFSDAHNNGDIHIHDLDFYGFTTTCCQIDLAKLFKDGFGTGHGSIREPQSIQTATNLACIAIQSNQNDQHGGQSIPNFDRALAPYVDRTFYKEYLDALESELETVLNLEPGAIDLRTVYVYTGDDTPLKYQATIPSHYTNDFLTDQYKEILARYNVVSTVVSNLQQRALQRACIATQQATFQAMEALVHNLNTMHSRAGSQVPFSSINFGTCTSDSGRLVAEKLMLAQEQGLGKGETPIFPILIFRLKEGVNTAETDPNYDLFNLACRVTSTRLFPNFSNQDAPFNLQYYDPEREETEIAYMGAVLGSSVVILKYQDTIETLSFKEAFEKYHDKQNVFIWDSNQLDFVKIKTWINNPDGGDWYKIKFSGGRVLTLTSDHPLPTQRGRVECKDLIVGDVVPLAKYNLIPQNENPDIDPWLLGMIVCDGRYENNIVVSVGLDEKELVDKIQQKYDKTSVKKLERGEKGNYFDVELYSSEILNRKKLSQIFGGVKKTDRRLPSNFLSWTFEDRLQLLSGIIDADGYINTNKGCTVEIGSTNKVLALEEMILAESLGCTASIYENHYTSNDNTKIRFLVSFQAPDNLPIVCQKKRANLNATRSIPQNDSYGKILSIEFLGSMNERRYDVETESDRFDVDGINSHNCRTRVVGNVNDKDREITYSRGNLSFTSINLPRLAIEAKGDVDKFFESLKNMEELCFDQLLERFELQCSKKVLNFPFLMGQGVWLDSDALNDKDELREVLKHGTLSVGFIGLAETLTALIGKHHGESEEAQELGLKIVRFMRELADKKAEETGLNFSLLATPAEGLSGRFVKMDAKRYGVLEGITDKKYYTNSFHVPVGYHISATHKIEIEAPYHALTNAGHISYIELDGDPSKNVEAVKELVLAMKNANMGYFALNHPVDIDAICGFQGVIPGHVCPSCGRTETKDAPFDRIRRVTGYLTGTLENFNNAKREEESQRVKHA